MSKTEARNHRVRLDFPKGVFLQVTPRPHASADGRIVLELSLRFGPDVNLFDRALAVAEFVGQAATVATDFAGWARVQPDGPAAARSVASKLNQDPRLDIARF